MTTNQELAAIFHEIADLLALQEASFFRVNAYRRAAQICTEAEDDLTKLSRAELLAIPGVGKELADKVVEYGETRQMQFLKDQRAAVPAGLRKMLAIPGLGPKKVALFYRELEIDTVAKLKKAAKNGTLETLPGIREKTVENILTGIDAAKTLSKNKRRALADVQPVAKKIVTRLKKVAGTGRVEVAGSLRRKAAIVGDVDILAESDDPGELMQTFTQLPDVAKVVGHGYTKSSIQLQDGLQVDLRVVPSESFGAALQYFTGSKDHNVEMRRRAIAGGMKLSEYGLFDTETGEQLAGADEKEIYKKLGLPYISPAKRLGKDEFEK